jgi:hypothetical protein
MRRLIWPLFFLACASAEAQGSFYSAADLDLAHYADGQLLRSEAISEAPDAATAYRILYRSEGLHGEPIAVSGVVIVPGALQTRTSGPIIAWAHPTTVPVFPTQGTDDTLVLPAVTRTYMQNLCKAGSGTPVPNDCQV